MNTYYVVKNDFLNLHMKDISTTNEIHPIYIFYHFLLTTYIYIVLKKNIIPSPSGNDTNVSHCLIHFTKLEVKSGYLPHFPKAVS